MLEFEKYFRIMIPSPPPQNSASAFNEIIIRDTRLKILKRYTNVRVIGAGAQGLVL